MTVLYQYCRVTVLSGVSSLNEEKESSDNESEHLKYRKLTDICRVFLLLFVTESLILCSDFFGFSLELNLGY